MFVYDHKEFLRDLQTVLMKHRIDCKMNMDEEALCDIFLEGLSRELADQGIEESFEFVNELKPLDNKGNYENGIFRPSRWHCYEVDGVFGVKMEFFGTIVSVARTIDPACLRFHGYFMEGVLVEYEDGKGNHLYLDVNAAASETSWKTLCSLVPEPEAAKNELSNGGV